MAAIFYDLATPHPHSSMPQPDMTSLWTKHSRIFIRWRKFIYLFWQLCKKRSCFCTNSIQLVPLLYKGHNRKRKDGRTGQNLEGNGQDWTGKEQGTPKNRREGKIMYMSLLKKQWRRSKILLYFRRLFLDMIHAHYTLQLSPLWSRHLVLVSECNAVLRIRIRIPMF